MRKIIIVIFTWGIQLNMSYSQNLVVNNSNLHIDNDGIVYAKGLTIGTKGYLENKGYFLVLGDIQNDGEIRNYNSVIEIGGNGNNYKGTGTNSFYNLVLACKKLSNYSKLWINNNLKFASGGVQNIGKYSDIMFAPNSAYKNANNTKHIQGKCTYYGNKSFLYPVGNGSQLRGMTILNKNFQKGISVNYVYSNSDVLYPHNRKENSIGFIDQNEFWEVDLKNRDLAYSISFYRNRFTSSPEINKAFMKDLLIVKWDFDSDKWVIIPQIKTNKTNTLISSKINSKGIYAIGYRKKDNNDFVKNNLVSRGSDALMFNKLNMYKDNYINIYDSNGNLVWNTSHYNNSTNAFRGHSNMPGVINQKLDRGTYYFVFGYKENGEINLKTGHLYVFK